MSMFKWMGLGQQSGKTTIDNDTVDEGERYFGLENFGNTCYSNSVVQALYFCKPFRHCVLNFPQQANSSSITQQQQLQQQQIFSPSFSTHPSSPMTNGHSNSSSSYFPSASSTTTLSSSSPAINGSTSKLSNGGASTPGRETPNNLKRVNGSSTPTTAVPIEKDQNNINLAPGMEDTLFSSLKDLFWKISTNRKKSGVIAPLSGNDRLLTEGQTELFRSSMHQDAHEFLNYTLNTIAEDVQKFQQRMNEEHNNEKQPENSIHSETTNSSTTDPAKTTWVHQLFEGIFSNETKCLSCETVTSRDECFMDLSIDVEINSSITSCLRQFSASETLCHKNKYFCDVCSGLQEAERRMKIKKLPNILALHLKRFKYQEQLQKYIKLTYRVVFPFELRLFNTSDDTEDADRIYELWAIVVHIGSGPHHGHYVAIIKSNGQWMLFDDDVVTQIQEEDIQKYFSDLPGSGSGYVLFYQAVDLNMDTINISTVESNTIKEETIDSNGRLVTSSSQQQHPTSNMPLRLDQLNLNESHTDLSKRGEDYVTATTDIPTPETTPPPSTSPVPPPASIPVAAAPAPVVHHHHEEKKTRWGLGRKIRGDKKDKK